MSNDFFPQPMPSIIEINIEKKKKQDYITKRNARLKELDDKIRNQRKFYDKKRRIKNESDKKNNMKEVVQEKVVNVTIIKHSSSENQLIAKRPVLKYIENPELSHPISENKIINQQKNEIRLPKICTKPISIYLYRKHQQFSRTI